MVRRYAVPVSMLVHAIVFGLIVATPFFAPSVLPGPATRLVFAAPAALRPEEPPPPIHAAPVREAPVPISAGAPTVSPPEITEETPVPDSNWTARIDAAVPGLGDRSVRIAEAPPPAPPAAAPLEPLRIGGQIREPRKIRNVDARYPPVALAARVSGSVVLDAVIGPDGRVRDVTVRTSAPLFDRAAIDAVRQWEFTPTLLNGVAVPVILTVTVNFSLR